MDDYVSMQEAMRILKLCKKTLQKYDNEGKIETIRLPNNYRRFNVKKYLIDNNLIQTSKNKKSIIYCRVSSYDRKDDLERQVNYLSTKYKDGNYEIITDIGSGINFKRKGLQKIIDYAINNELKEVIVTYKDRLCRIGYDLIKHMLTKYSNADIIIDNKEDKSPNQEITEDLIEIITVYSSKIHGKRSNQIDE